MSFAEKCIAAEEHMTPLSKVNHFFALSNNQSLLRRSLHECQLHANKSPVLTNSPGRPSGGKQTGNRCLRAVNSNSANRQAGVQHT